MIRKWKCLGTTANQPQFGRPYKRGQWTLEHIEQRGYQLSTELITIQLKTSYLLQIYSWTVHWEPYGVCFQLPMPYITKCNVKCKIQWCKASCHWTSGQWSSIFCSDKSDFSTREYDGWVWVWRLPGEQCLSDCIVPHIKFGRGGFKVWGCFWEYGLGPLLPVKWNLNASAYQDFLEMHIFPTL